MKAVPSNFLRLHIEKVYFSMNPSFRQVQTCFMSSENSMLLFRAFYLMLETIIETRENQFEMENIFLLV